MIFHFYLLNFSNQKKLFADITVPIEISELEVQDIDNEIDWKLAELKFQILQNLDGKK